MEVKEEYESDLDDTWLKQWAVENCSEAKTEDEFKREDEPANSDSEDDNRKCEASADSYHSASVATTHNTYSQVEYACPACDLRTRTLNVLHDHFRSSSHVSGPHTANDADKFITKRVLFQCQMCTESILADSSMILRHLQNEHKIDARKYRSKFGLRGHDDIPKDAILSAEVIGDLCSYRCQTCGKTFTTKAATQRHLGKRHGTAQYVNDHLSKAVVHGCKLCTKRILILCDSKTLLHHFRRCHKVTSLSEYCRMTGCTEMEKPEKPTNPHYVEGKSFVDSRVPGTSHDLFSDNTFGLCEFGCHACGFFTHQFEGLRKHFAKTGHGPKNPTYKEDLFKYARKLVYHICKECSVRITCENSIISAHVKSKHGLSAKQYRLKHGLPLWRNCPEGAETADEIGNLCVFKCKDCGLNFAASSRVRKHVHRHHKTSSRLKMNDYIKKAVMHRCQLCQKDFLCNRETLANHFRKAHRLASLQEYCDKTGCRMVSFVKLSALLEAAPISNEIRNLCRFKCPDCDATADSWRKMRSHSCPKNAKYSKFEMGRFVQDCIAYRCHLCQTLLPCDATVIYMHVKRKHEMPLDDFRSSAGEGCKAWETKEYWDALRRFKRDEPVWPAQALCSLPPDAIPSRNLCRKLGNLWEFSCPSCDKLFTSYASFVAHRRNKHGYDPSLVKTARYHSCLICSRILLCDHIFIGEHLTKNHPTMTPAKYRATFKKHGGEVFPFYIDRFTVPIP